MMEVKILFNLNEEMELKPGKFMINLSFSCTL